MEELCDENVHLKNISDILALHIPQHVNEPLKLAMGGADPEEVYLREGGGSMSYSMLLPWTLLLYPCVVQVLLIGTNPGQDKVTRIILNRGVLKEREHCLLLGHCSTCLLMMISSLWKCPLSFLPFYKQPLSICWLRCQIPGHWGWRHRVSHQYHHPPSLPPQTCTSPDCHLQMDLQGGSEGKCSIVRWEATLER